MVLFTSCYCWLLLFKQTGCCSVVTVRTLQHCSQPNIKLPYRFVSGKILLRQSESMVDEIWRKIAEATFEGKLGTACKVGGLAPANFQGVPCVYHSGGGQVVENAVRQICIYTMDFRDSEDIKRIVLELNAFGIHVSCGFKPDFFTALGIYSGDQKYKADATIYKKEIKDWQNRTNRTEVPAAARSKRGRPDLSCASGCVDANELWIDPADECIYCIECWRAEYGDAPSVKPDWVINT